MSSGETTLHMPVKKITEDDSVRKTTRLGRGAKIAGRRIGLPLDKIAVTKHPQRIARTTSARWTSFCMHLGLVPSRNKHAKMSPRELRPRNMCQKVTVFGKLPWWNLRRGAKLRGSKTHHRDGNHATRKSKALVPP